MRSWPLPEILIISCSPTCLPGKLSNLLGLGLLKSSPYDSHLDNVNWTRRAKLYWTELVNKAFSDSSWVFIICLCDISVLGMLWIELWWHGIISPLCPQGTKQEKNLVKPLYDRYQMVKRLLCASSPITTIVSACSLAAMLYTRASTAQWACGGLGGMAWKLTHTHMHYTHSVYTDTLKALLEMLLP